MRCFVLLTIFACFLAMAWSARSAGQQATNLFDVDAGINSGDEKVRQVRQFYGGYGRPGGFYGRPGGIYGRPGGYYGSPFGGRPYGGYGGYGGYPGGFYG
ncbi:uncharacterized protein LOC101901377 [Musca domestica]|uniref:ATP-dependent RNA helicase ded1-like n=1 Tax=Musca domestica TaxID=7370 RepID=A0A1I8NFI0_MUSDO|nr:uncharacterized protein LOC101901377 [Musca domestica]